MVRFTVKRLVRAVITLVMVSLLTFTLLQLAPGDFADLSAVTSGATMTAQGQRAEVMTSFTNRYGDEVPAWQQYLIFMKGAVTWDMGPSYKYPALTVEGIIGDAFPVSATIAVLARYVRSAVIETLREEYVTTAIAKGGPGRTIMVRHVLRNSLIPVVTVVGPIVASLMAGTVFIETMFRIPGLGQYFTGAATSRDMPLLMGTTLFFAALLVITNVIVDVSYGILDPRTRMERRAA